MRIIQISVCIILILALMPYAYALKTGVVVDVNGDIYKGCVLTEKGNSAYDVLKKFDGTNDNIKMQFDGVIMGTPFLRSINDIEGKSVGDNKFSGWNFWISSNDNGFKEPPELAPGWGMGFGDYKIENEIDVIGVNFGVTEFNPDGTVKVMAQKPDYAKYSQLCETLNIKSVKAYVDGKKEAGVDEDGGKINVIPGSELELKITVENLYDRDDNIDIGDISIGGILESIGDGKDLEDEATNFNLAPKSDREASLKFDIPLEVEDGDYDLIVTVEGENENGFSYSKEIEFEVEVDKEKHDITFNKLKFSNDKVECGKPAILEVNAINFGVNDETVKLAVSNEELKVNLSESFALSHDPFSKDNSFSKAYKIMLPSGISSGIYSLRADLFYGNDIKSSTVELNVKCNDLSNQASKEIKPAVNNPTPKNNNPAGLKIKTMPAEVSGAAASAAAEEKKISNKDILMASVFVGEILLLIGGIALLIYLRK